MELPWSLFCGSAPITLLAACLCFAAPLCCFLHYRHFVCNYKLPPGSAGLPLLGETLQFALLSTCPIGTPLPFFSSRLRRYGTIFKTHILGRPTVVSMDPDLTKLLLNTEGKIVQGYLPVFFKKILGSVTIVHGAQHRVFRELGSLAASSNAVQKWHMDTVQDHFSGCLRSWLKRPSHEVFDAQQECKEWVFNYSIKFFLGLEADDPTTKLLMPEFFILSSGYSSIPINLPGTTFNKAIKARKTITSTIAVLAKSRKQQGRKEAKDFLDIILQKTDESGEHLSGLPVADWIYAFILGGFENTFVLFVNVLKFLSENVQMINELRRENLAIQRTTTQAKKLTWDDYQKMHFTRNVVKETLRLGNIVPYLLRETLSDISFKGMVIPKGWMVVLNFTMVHLHPNYYPDPFQFNPWRWMESTDNNASNNPNYFTPFGGGPRGCTGSNFAMFEAAIFIHHLVTLYKWKRVPVTSNESRDEASCMSLPRLRNGLLIKVQPLDTNSC